MDTNTLATQNDIAQLKAELARDFGALLQEAFGNMPAKRWLKSSDVKKILGFPTVSCKLFGTTAPYRSSGSAVQSIMTTRISSK